MRVADASPKEPWTWRENHNMTALDGAFDFGTVAPGSYIFGANLNFSSQDGPYYRKAFFPGTGERAEAGIVEVGAGESVANLRFFLPPDSPPPTVSLNVTVLGFDGKPIPTANVIAADRMWENSVTNLTAMTDETGRGTVVLRAGNRYDILAYENLADFSQACAEPQLVEANETLKPVVLKVSHHFGNCLQFRKRE